MSIEWCVHQRTFKESRLCCALESENFKNLNQLVHIFCDLFMICYLSFNNLFMDFFQFLECRKVTFSELLLMCLFSWSEWRLSEVESEFILNDRNSWCHLIRKRFKECFCQKSLSDICIKFLKQSDSSCCFTNFKMCLISSNSFSVNVSICVYWLWDISLSQSSLQNDWISHDIDNVSLIRELDSDDNHSWLSRLWHSRRLFILFCPWIFKKILIIST